MKIKACGAIVVLGRPADAGQRFGRVEDLQERNQLASFDHEVNAAPAHRFIERARAQTASRRADR